MKKGNIYLIPITLGDTPLTQVIPDWNLHLLNKIDYYIVENIKVARRFLKKAGIKKDINELTFFETNKRVDPSQYPTYIKPALEGNNIGVISDAGCPGIADPGAEIVALSHQKNLNVIPLVGPSSILLALMASGLNGQNFAFNGYLPKNQKERITKIKELERISRKNNQSQIFIETPYRNNHLMEDLSKYCSTNTLLCIACDITLPNEIISTKKISQWKKCTIDLNKKPCIFIIQ